MSKIAKMFLKVLKCIFWLAVTAIVAVNLGILGFEVAVKLSDEPERSAIIEKQEAYYEWCYNAYNDSKEWCLNAFNDAKQWSVNAFENAKEWCTNTINDAKELVSGLNQDEELEVEGAKLNDISSYEIGKYINFTIPYGWKIGEVKVEDDATEESIMLQGTNIVMSVSLKNVEGPKNLDGLNWTREAMIFDLKNKYSDYTFEKLEIIDDKAAVIGITAPGVETKMYMAIVSADKKTIIVTYTFDREAFVEAELYFAIALGEMVESLK